MHVIVLVLQMGHLRLRKVRQVLLDTSRTNSNWQWAEMGLEPEFCLTLTQESLPPTGGTRSFLLIFLLVTSDSLVSWFLTNSAFF